MKSLRSLIALMILASTGYSAMAQTVDYNKIILPDASQSEEFEERLVQLAWRNHPTNEAVRREVNLAEYDVKQANASWLDNIRITGNLNEFTLNKAADPWGRAAFFPRYNVSASITLGTFFNTPYTIRKNREALIITQANVNARKLEVRNAVLKLYNDYQMRERMYRLQSQALIDNETSHKLAEQRFRRGEITFEQYSTSLSLYNDIVIQQLQAERDFKNAKLDLEQMIGVRLEDVR